MILDLKRNDKLMHSVKNILNAISVKNAQPYILLYKNNY